MKIVLLLSVFVLLWPTSTPASPTDKDCAAKTDLGEKLMDKGQNDKAYTVLQEALKACASSNVRGARAHMALGTLLNRKQKYREAIQILEEGLKKEPGLALAYMNICACYIGLNDYTNAIQNCEKGLQTKNKSKSWKAMLNHNMGLAYFNQAADKEDTKDKRSEPYFKESMKLDPTIGANYYFLGVLSEVSDGDYPQAKKYYDQGCKKGHQMSCQWLQTIDQRIAQYKAQAASSQATQRQTASVPVNLTPEETKLYQELKALYLQKGMPGDAAENVVKQLQQSYAKFPAPQRVTMLQQVLKSMK